MLFSLFALLLFCSPLSIASVTAHPIAKVMVGETGQTELKKVPLAKKITVKLLHIEKIKASESQGDELYFDVLAYGSNQHPTHHRIPPFPHHWPSFVLDKIKNITLWQSNLPPHSNIKLIVSLVEKDAPPWNANDVLGSFELVLKRTAGGLAIHYQELGKVESSIEVKQQLKQNVIFSLNGAEYRFLIDVH